MRLLSLPALPLTRIISNSTHTPHQVMGHGLGPSKTPLARGAFGSEQGGAEWRSLVAVAGVAVMSRSMASESGSLSSSPASPLLACDSGKILSSFSLSSLCCKPEAQDRYHQGVAQTQWDTKAQWQAHGNPRTRAGVVFVKVSGRAACSISAWDL